MLISKHWLGSLKMSFKVSFKFGQIQYSEIEREESQEIKGTYKEPYIIPNERGRDNEKV